MCRFLDTKPLYCCTLGEFTSFVRSFSVALSSKPWDNKSSTKLLFFFQKCSIFTSKRTHRQIIMQWIIFLINNSSGTQCMTKSLRVMVNNPATKPVISNRQMRYINVFVFSTIWPVWPQAAPDTIKIFQKPLALTYWSFTRCLCLLGHCCIYVKQNPLGCILSYLWPGNPLSAEERGPADTCCIGSWGYRVHEGVHCNIQHRPGGGGGREKERERGDRIHTNTDKGLTCGEIFF